jgi:hypothetical protein
VVVIRSIDYFSKTSSSSWAALKIDKERGMCRAQKTEVDAA